MPDYISPEIDSNDDDPSAIAEAIREYMATNIPGWTVWPASPENLLIEAFALEHAETRRASTGVGQTFDRIARSFGVSVYGIPALDPVPASGTSSWTMIDDTGYTIPAGTQLTLRSADGSRVGFEVSTDIIVTAGNTTASGVQIIAVEVGEGGNGLSEDPRLEDEWDFVDDISVEAPTTGGDDGETDEEYLDRFFRRQRRNGEQLILADDFASFTADFFDDGGRAAIVPLYDASTGTPDVAGTFTVFPIAPDGGTRTASEKAALLDAIEEHLLTGVTAGVLDATYTNISVEFVAICYSPYEPSQVQASIAAAIGEFLSPARWGLPPYSEDPIWVEEPLVRINDLIDVIMDVAGVRHVTSVTINGGTSNVALSGVAGLPVPQSITGTVTT
jgi:hypothetical protein